VFHFQKMATETIGDYEIRYADDCIDSIIFDTHALAIDERWCFLVSNKHWCFKYLDDIVNLYHCFRSAKGSVKDLETIEFPVDTVFFFHNVPWGLTLVPDSIPIPSLQIQTPLFRFPRHSSFVIIRAISAVFLSVLADVCLFRPANETEWKAWQDARKRT
jgi:hypothetical protein